jgi:hypothetical protein
MGLGGGRIKTCTTAFPAYPVLSDSIRDPPLVCGPLEKLTLQAGPPPTSLPCALRNPPKKKKKEILIIPPHLCPPPHVPLDHKGT